MEPEAINGYLSIMYIVREIPKQFYTDSIMILLSLLIKKPLSKCLCIKYNLTNFKGEIKFN